MGSVLVVCLGNVCRSPYAEAALRRMLPSLRVASAGLIGAGRSVPPEALKIGRERGLDLSRHVSRIATKETAAGYDLIVVMEPRQTWELEPAIRKGKLVIVLGDLDPVAQGRRTIADPWGKELDEFRASFDRIDRCLASLVEGMVAGRFRRAHQRSGRP